MEVKKLVLATAVFGALGGLYGCSGDEDVNIVIEGDQIDGGPSGGVDIRELYPFATFDETGASSCPGSTNLEVSGGFGVCVLPTVIEEDLTLTNDIPWVIQNRVVVGNGDGMMTETDGVLASGDDLLDVTLTIEPGTYILGDGRGANMVVSRGSRIEAEGTASAPITFSSIDDGFLGVGEWGGLIIHGFGLHNVCDYDTPTACNIDAEGDSGFAGGHDNTDNSGTLRYVIVTEAGEEIANGDEINGISFVAVGSGTTVEFIQVNQNLDDGVEFYGGDVDARYVLLTGNGDDSVDWDEGWTGNLQYVLVLQAENFSEGTTVEADTLGTLSFLSEPTIMNATFVGAGAQNTLHALRAATGGYFHNIVMTGLAGEFENCVQLRDSGVVDNVATGNLIYNNVIADCERFEDTRLGDDVTEGTTSLVDAGGALNIFSVSASLDTNFASTAMEATGITPVVASDFSPVAEDDFFDATTFIGAVDPSAGTPWFDGWAIPGSLDLDAQ